MSSNIKTGVIGVGSMGKNHARVYSEVSDLVGVSDLNENLGREIASLYGVKFFSDYKDLLEQVEAVTIAVPTKHHLNVSRDTLISGTHLLIEKPLSSDYNDSKDILELHKGTGLILSVGHIERHNPVVKELKFIIDKETLGHPITLSTRRFSSFPGRIVDVGVIFDLAIHDIDILNYLSGSKAVSVYALGGNHKNKNCEDFVSLLIDFENGIKGLCESNWLTPFKVRNLSMTTDLAFVEADYINQVIEVSNSTLLEKNDKNPIFKVEKERITVQKSEPLKNEIINFLDAIKGNADLLVNGQDGLQAVKIAEASLESLKTGKKVFLNDS